MSKQSIYNFFKVNSSLFKQNFTDAIRLAKPDSIHDLRVSIKRIGALIKLLNYGKTSNYRIKNNYPHLKLVFKTAALVRDFQVLGVLLLNYTQYKDLNIEELNNQVKQFRQEAIKDFFLNSKQFNFLAISRLFGIIENYIKNLDELQLESQFDGFNDNHLLLLINYSNPLSGAYNLHSARKIIKDLGYLIEMTEPGQEANISQLSLYKEAGRYLGDWHDRLVLQDFLNNKARIIHSKNGTLTSLVELLGNEKDTLKSQYFNLLKIIDTSRF